MKDSVEWTLDRDDCPVYRANESMVLDTNLLMVLGSGCDERLGGMDLRQR